MANGSTSDTLQLLLLHRSFNRAKIPHFSKPAVQPHAAIALGSSIL